MNKIDRIILSNDRTKCVIILEGDDVVEVDFKELGVDYIDGLAQIYAQYEVLDGEAA